MNVSDFGLPNARQQSCSHTLSRTVQIKKDPDLDRVADTTSPFEGKRASNHTLTSGTFPYRPYGEVPPSSPPSSPKGAGGDLNVIWGEAQDVAHEGGGGGGGRKARIFAWDEKN